MPEPTRKRELGRGERVLPGVWRLRLPLPWPGVPHCNAWAVAAGDGIVLVRHRHARARVVRAPRARARPGEPAGRQRQAARLHARPRRPLRAGGDDHRADGVRAVDAPQPRAHDQGGAGPRGRAGAPRRDRAHERRARDAAAGLRRSRARARASASPGSSTPIATCSPASRSRPTSAPGRSSRRRATRRRTSACYQPDRRLLISGDHLLGRVSLYFDYGYTPDPVGEFLESLNKVEDLDMRLCLAGHARPFTDVAGAHHRQPRGRRRAAGGLPARRWASTGRSPRSRPCRSCTARRSRRSTRTGGSARRSATCSTSRSPGAPSARPASWTATPSAGRSRPSLSGCAHRRDPEGQRGAGLLVRVLPAQDRRAARRNLDGALRELGPLEPDLRLGHLRRRRVRPREQDDRHRLAHQGATTGSRRWRTSPASARPTTSCARRSTRCATPGIDNVLALRGDPPAGSGASGRRPRAAWSTRAS